MNLPTSQLYTLGLSMSLATSPLKTNWVVITGAPSSGKTTIINCLDGLGYEVCHDVAREVIENSRRNLPEISEKEKQRLIVEILSNKQKSFSKSKLIFFDYGMPENLVFQELAGVKINKTKIESIRYKYKAVFLLEPLKIVQDGIRTIDHETQQKIHNKINQVYINLGYSPIIIDKVDVEYRLKSIFRHLESTT
jgi:predicted ATPase